MKFNIDPRGFRTTWGHLLTATVIGFTLSSCKPHADKQTSAPMAGSSGQSVDLPSQITDCAVPLNQIAALSGTFKVGSFAEWKTAKDVIVHTPGDEIFPGIIHPAAALFEQPFSLEGAQREHANFICLLKKNGARVFRLVDILQAGTIDDKGGVVQGQALSDLQAFAGQFLKYDTSGLPPDMRSNQEEYRKSVLKALHPRELVRILFMQPTVKLVSTAGHNTGYAASYIFSPVMNHYFMRDQVITTAAGMVIGKFNATQRDIETQIAAFAYRKLGIKPVFQITGEGRLEGGDFIPAGDNAFLGQGLRTNPEAVRQMLEARAFGAKRVLIVKDPWKNQVQMHLDTYFNIIGDKLAAMVEDRMDIKDANGKVVKPANPAKKPTVDVYELNGASYQLVVENAPYQDYLEKNLGYNFIPASVDDQLKYGLNFVAVTDRIILAIDGVSEDYKNRLKDAGVTATWMSFRNLTSGYGAAHCTTQVIRRE